MIIVGKICMTVLALALCGACFGALIDDPWIEEACLRVVGVLVTTGVACVLLAVLVRIWGLA